MKNIYRSVAAVLLLALVSGLAIGSGISGVPPSLSGTTCNGCTLSGTTTNSGTISGGSVSGAAISGGSVSNTTTLPSSQGAGWALINTQTFSSNTTSVVWDNTMITSAYDVYLIVFKNIHFVNDNVVLDVSVSTNNGSTYASSGYMIGTTNVGALGSASFWSLSQAGNANNSATRSLHGFVRIEDPLSSTRDKAMSFDIEYPLTGTGVPQWVQGRGTYDSTTAVNNIRFTADASGNFTGTFYLYAMKNQ